MEWEYDLYECMPTGALARRGLARGVEETRRQLRRLNRETGHACYSVCKALLEFIRDTSDRQLSRDALLRQGDGKGPLFILYLNGREIEIALAWLWERSHGKGAYAQEE